MTKTVDVKTVVSGARNNKQIWRVAEFMHDAVTVSGDEDFCHYRIWYKERIYDKAAELMKKIQLNEFTGEDTHGD